MPRSTRGRRRPANRAGVSIVTAWPESATAGPRSPAVFAGRLLLRGFALQHRVCKLFLGRGAAHPHVELLRPFVVAPAPGCRRVRPRDRKVHRLRAARAGREATTARCPWHPGPEPAKSEQQPEDRQHGRYDKSRAQTPLNAGLERTAKGVPGLASVSQALPLERFPWVRAAPLSFSLVVVRQSSRSSPLPQGSTVTLIAPLRLSSAVANASDACSSG